MMASPRSLVESIEFSVALPPGKEERFSGYGVMGLTFASGHVLALRRWPASSLGKSYTSVWHRNPEEHWTFVQNVQPQHACPRYFGNAVSKALVRTIEIVWSGEHEFCVTITGDYSVEWHVTLVDTLATRALNVVGGLVPKAVWRNATVLRAIQRVGGSLLGGGNMSLTGRVPNGQTFMANPRYVWAIASSWATVCGEDLGKIGPLGVQARIGDVWIPQNGRFFIGSSFLEPFDPIRHLSVTSMEG
jgi:hypothetical protein